ncbi:MAG: Plug domain-containing protein, partial [Bacteroidota bacterium]|nr:Plug domain-containing protein [Bacteroidota bacterium]
MNLFKVSLICFIFCQLPGFCQSPDPDSSLQLNVVEVSGSRQTVFSSGNKTETLDSLLLEKYNTNLADILINESQIFIKSYGLGSLATTSFRGAGSSHTAVLWNGFNLQSPMNGLLDVSLVPSGFIKNIQIQYGGSGALWGSGAVGGT